MRVPLLAGDSSCGCAVLHVDTGSGDLMKAALWSVVAFAEAVVFAVHLSDHNVCVRLSVGDSESGCGVVHVDAGGGDPGVFQNVAGQLVPCHVAGTADLEAIFSHLGDAAGCVGQENTRPDNYV